MSNFQSPGSLIPDAWFLKLIFSLTVNFYLTKIGNRIYSNTAFILLLLVMVPLLPKMLIFGKQKNANFSKTKKVWELKSRISETVLCTHTSF